MRTDLPSLEPASSSNVPPSSRSSGETSVTWNREYFVAAMLTAILVDCRSFTSRDPTSTIDYSMLCHCIRSAAAGLTSLPVYKTSG